VPARLLAVTRIKGGHRDAEVVAADQGDDDQVLGGEFEHGPLPIHCP